MLSTQFDFILPRGLVDGQGQIHRKGTMRLATARDEMQIGRDRTTRDYPAYGTLVMLSQVILQLGSLEHIPPTQLENLFTQDLAYLKAFYNQVNQQGSAKIPTECPECQTQYDVELVLAGES
jgi:hypothetical protein